MIHEYTEYKNIKNRINIRSVTFAFNNHRLYIINLSNNRKHIKQSTHTPRILINILHMYTYLYESSIIHIYSFDCIIDQLLSRSICQVYMQCCNCIIYMFAITYLSDSYYNITSACYLRNKIYVPVFYRGNKLWVRFWVRMN